MIEWISTYVPNEGLWPYRLEYYLCTNDYPRPHQQPSTFKKDYHHLHIGLNPRLGLAMYLPVLAWYTYYGFR